MEQNRWKNFTKREQIMMIGAEFMRAKTWQHKNPSLRSGTLFPNGNKNPSLRSGTLFPNGNKNPSLRSGTLFPNGNKNPSLRSGTLFPNGNKDQDKFHLALERALELIDLTLSDDKWRDNTLALLRLRDEVAKFYVAERTDDISFLYKAL